MPRPERERGAALLTVLLLVAVIAVLAATGLERLRVTTRLAGNVRALDQARGYALAAEVLATTRVTALLERAGDKVTLDGGWSGRPYALPVPGGAATARVTDGANCFNLNALVRDDGGGWSAYPPAVDQFARLMTLLRVEGQPQAIAAAAADWIDSDDAVTGAGAEDAAYASRGMRTAGTLMADASELRAVAGVSAATYAALRPWLCALPVAEPAPLNVNTLAPEQAPLVAALAPPGVGVEAVRSALLRRPLGGWEDTAAFLASPGLEGLGGLPDGLAVTSQWFALAVDVRLDGSDLTERALIDARTLPARLVSRQWGEAT